MLSAGGKSEWGEVRERQQPRIIFGSAALANQPQVIPEQRKLAICGEWFQRVESPVFVDVSYELGEGLALEVLGRMLRRLAVGSDEVVVHLALDCGRAIECWEKSCRLLGDEYRPKIVSVWNVDAVSWRLVTGLKSSGMVRGLGIATNDICLLERLDPAPDWISLCGGISLMYHPREVVESLRDMARRQMPIVISGVFEGGFLVGGNRRGGQLIDPSDPANRSQLAWRTAFAALCHGHGVKPAHACVQFAMSCPGVVAVRLNSSYPERVAENVEAVQNQVSDNFWAAMIEEGLLSVDFPFVEA